MSSLRSSHAQSAKQILDELNVSRLSGLSENEAKSRLLSQGQNHLKEKPPKKAITLLLEQFQGFLILILVAAAVLAAVIGDLRDAIVILIVVCINALLGFYQEFRAEKSLQALKNMLSPEAVVRRNTQIMKILAKELVPGDIVILESGSRVSADGRIIKENNIEVDESTLTGESHTVKKQVEAISVETSLAERSNMLYMNTIITRGRGEMVVTGTGMQTEMGRLAKMLDESEDATTPLQIQLDSLGKRLALIAGIVVFLMIIIGFLRDEPWVQIIMTAIVLAVAAIPEGLPAVATITLALGMRRMAQHGAIVKRLAAVETLGCTTVICSDKTGTLTHNEMTVRAFYHQNTHFDVEGEGYQKEGNIKTQQNTLDLTHLIRPIMLCNDATIHDEEVLGDPMEAAFLILGQKAGFSRDDLTQQFPRVAEIPFD